MVGRALIISSEWSRLNRDNEPRWVPRQADFLRARGLEIDPMLFNGGKDPSKYLAARRDLRSKLTKGSYDVVHAEHGHCALVALGCGVPLVLTLHDTDLRTTSQPAKAMDRWLLPPLNRWVAQRADAVIVISERSRRRLPHRVKPHMIPWGLDLDLFRPRSKLEARRQLGLPIDRKIVLFSGNPFSQYQRYERGVEAVCDLRARCDVTLISAESESPQTLARYMNACDALLLMSPHGQWEELVDEAVASGLPVVSSGVEEFIEWTSGLPGCTLSPDDQPGTIAGMLELVFEYDAPPVDLTVPERFDERVAADRVLSVYASVAAGSRTSRA
jgi:glycosyltransferase involved in cell wall biosynthesis